MKIVLKILLIYLISNTNHLNSQEFEFDRQIDIPLSIASSGVLASGYYLRTNDSKLDNSFEIKSNTWLNENFDNYFKFSENESLSEISDYFVYSLLAAPIIYSATESIDETFWATNLFYAQAQFFNVGINFSVKDLILRQRPFESQEIENPKENLLYDEMASFYSGHTTVAFASAVFLGLISEKQFGNNKFSGLVWSLGLGLASSTGILRVLSGNHYISDVIIGAIMGSLISYTILEIHKKNHNNSEQSPINRLSISFKL